MSDLTVMAAVRNIILDLAIVPATPTVQTAGAGAQTVSLTSVAGFVPGALLDWDDGLGERRWKIQTVDPAARTVTLDFTNTGQSGLSFTHPFGVTAYTNLYPFIPTTIAVSLAAGLPVLFLYTIEGPEALKTARTGGATHVLMIEERRSLIQGAAPMDTNVFADLQQESARADIETIATAVRTHWTLTRTPSGAANAVGLGYRNSPAPYLTKRFGRFATEAGDVQQFVAQLEVVIQDLWTPIS